MPNAQREGTARNVYLLADNKFASLIFITRFVEMSVWQQDTSGYSPCVEIDSSSVRTKERLSSPSWLKQEQEDLRIIKWENFQSGTSADAVQDNTPSSAMSGKVMLKQRFTIKFQSV